MNTKAHQLINEERKRHVEVKGWTSQHDDTHVTGCLGTAAYCYENETDKPMDGNWWPFDMEWWKPSENRERNLVKSGSMYLAEIERLKRRFDAVVIEINELIA